MAEYRLVCVGDVVPGSLQPEHLGLSFPHGTTVLTQCPGGTYWTEDGTVFQPLTVQDGLTLSGAIIGVWAVGWAGRQVIRVIRR